MTRYFFVKKNENWEKETNTCKCYSAVPIVAKGWSVAYMQKYYMCMYLSTRAPLVASVYTRQPLNVSHDSSS